MKDSVRKEMLAVFQNQKSEPTVQQLEEEYKRKGVLSKRELKILFSVARVDQEEAA